MPRYTVTALEKFVVRTVYAAIEAAGPEEAERIVRDGQASYDSHAIEEGGEEYLETVSVEEEQEGEL
ncbi:MAG: hypothetical protein U0835_00525 [Isosphaeraceae bacterium]